MSDGIDDIDDTDDTDDTDDWFERALADDGEAEDADEKRDRDEDREGDRTGLESGSESEPARDVESTETTDEDAEPELAFETDSIAGDAPDVESDTGDDDNESETGDENDALFDEGFGEALQNVDVPGVADSEGGDADGAIGASGDDPTGPEGFADVDFGLVGPDGAGPGAEFDADEDVDSALPRVDLGVEGLDRMIQGGVPERSLMVAIGSAGTGKTTLGLQFLDHGLERGERGVFITLEESRERVVNSAVEKGYAFDEYVADDRLAVVDIDPVEMTNSLASIRNELPRLVDEFGASRLVLDSVSLLEMMYEDRATRRNEIYDFTTGLKEAGVTALLTSEAAAETAYASRYGIVEYLTDAVFVMQYVRPEDFRETRLAIEIQKIRDANHSREKKPYELTDEGISVYQQANLF